MGVRMTVFRAFNVVNGVLALPIIAAGIWILIKDRTNCLSIHEWSIIVFIGLFMLILSPMGVFASAEGHPPLLWIYLALTFILILLLSCFTVFSFLATNGGAGVPVPGRTFKEYNNLGDFSERLQSHVALDGLWKKTKSCLLGDDVCANFDKKYTSLDDLNNGDLSPIESGCCKPPSTCQLTFVNATHWTSPQEGGIGEEGSQSDCSTWKNERDELCFDCISCRAGVLESVKRDWRTVTIANGIMLLFLVLAYCIGCCAFLSAKKLEYEDDTKFNLP